MSETDAFKSIQQEYEHIMSLADIAEYLPEVTPNQLYRWSEPERDNGFPEVKEVIGRYRLYDRNEVLRWVVLYKKATKNLGRGRELNGG